MELIKKYPRLISFLAVFLYCIYACIILIPQLNIFNSQQSLVLLANQFLHGKISLAPTIDLPVSDIAKYNGKYYLYFGPFPSLFLMPFTMIFGKNFPQVSIGIFSLVLSFYAAYSLAIFFNFSKVD